MKKLLILALCTSCTFGVDVEDVTNVGETVDQGGVRVTPVHIHLDNGLESLDITDVEFHVQVDDIFAEGLPVMALMFDYDGHTLELETSQIERLTLAGGRTSLRVDGEFQVVDVTTTTSQIARDVYSSVSYDRVPEDLRYQMVDLQFSFRPEANATPVSAILSVEAEFHCPPFDTHPAEVEEGPAPVL